jgi:hypothetical protein
MSTDPVKIQVITQWPKPTSIKDLHNFLGLASFIQDLSNIFCLISKPLTYLLKKHDLFIWIADHKQAFELLKTALITAHVFVLPDFLVFWYLH